MKRNIAKTTLFLVVVGVALVALPAAGAPLAQPCLAGGNIGDCPGWVDMNGNGIWDPGVDKLISFEFTPPGVAAASLKITNPWSDQCGDSIGNVITLGGSTGCGFTTASKPFNGMTQEIMATGTVNGLPNAFSLFQEGETQGTGALTSGSGNPPYSGIQLSGGIDLLVGPFQGVDASGKGGTFNHATIPWMYASALGMNGPCKIAPNDPQIFLPVVPGTDPGTFQFVPKFGGVSVGMCSSPEILLAAFQPAINIPTLSEWGLILLLVGLGIAGWELLRRSGALA